MGIDKKVRIKSLSDKLKILKEKLKQMESLKKMVTELAEKVKKLENVDNTKTIDNELCCRKFSNKTSWSWAESSSVELRSNYALPDTAKLKPNKYSQVLTAFELLKIKCLKKLLFTLIKL